MSGQRPGRPSFASVFDEAMVHSGTSTAALRARLADRGHRVAASTLGYWRNGQRQPERADSREAVAEIESILRLPTGSLTGAIGASRRSGPPVHQAGVSDLPSMSPAMTEALATLEMDSLRPGHVEEALDIVADIDTDGRWTRMVSRSRLRAISDGVTRSTGFCQGTPGSGAARVAVDAGGTLGRTVRSDEHGIVVAEILLERPLDAGETAMLEYTFTFGDVTDVEFGTFAANRLSTVSVWARFSPERTPRRAWRFTQQVGEDEVVTALRAAPGTSLHSALRAFGPGLMGVRWEW